MSDIASCNEKILYKEFGKNALFLIEHAKGLEPCTIKEIKEYQPKNTSLSTGQILKEDYNYQKTRIVLTEMINDLTQELVSKKLYTDTVYIYIGYSKNLISPLKISKKYDHLTNNYSTIVKTILKEYDYQVNKKQLIRRINVAFLNTKTTKIEQLDIFTNQQFDEEAEKIEQTINKVQNKYGQNSLLRAISLKEGATQKERNKLIGGHNAE